MSVDQVRIRKAVREIIEAIGENPDREGLRDTPARVARFWAELIDHDSGIIDTVFEAGTCDQMVIVSGIRVWSLCEHHLLPFWCDISIGYIPDGKILGLSKFARIAKAFAHSLQVQERLVAQIAEEIELLAGTSDVAVIGRGEHLCMSMRGVKSPAKMTTSVMSGKFRELAAVRQEFIDLVK